jgi:glycosyltransferase involved in cell wall biosynthesis
MGPAVSAKLPFFSTVIDNHNYGRFLRQAIDGALAQDVPAGEHEVVVVDDGSTDQSREILASYGNRIRAVLQPQQGQASAFNRGFSEARGQVVCLLDSDDWWRPEKLARCGKLFDDPKVAAVQHYLEDADAAGPLPQVFPDWPERYSIGDFLDARTHFTATSGLLIRKKSLVEIPKELFYYLDDYLTVRALLDGALANVPLILGAHRIHGSNWCAGGFEDPRKLERDFRMRELMAEALAKWLGERGLKTTERFRAVDELESWRRRVLHASLSAKPVDAWRLWLEKVGGKGGFSFFRSATLLLAVVSPSLYLALYRAYSGAGALRALRLRRFPS